MAQSADHVFVEGGTVLTFTHSIVAKGLGAHLPDGLLAEELEGLRHGIWRYPLALETDLLHAVDLAGWLVGQVLLRIPGHPLHAPLAVDQPLREQVGEPRGSLGLGPYDLGRSLFHAASLDLARENSGGASLNDSAGHLE